MTIKEMADAQAAFMAACGQYVDDGLPNGAMANLYLELLKEEFMETIEAWNEGAQENARLGAGADVVKHTAKVVDGLMDMTFVIIGVMNHMKVRLDLSWDEVVISNQSKLGPNPKFREDGKLLKDANFVEPDFERVVRESWAI